MDFQHSPQSGEDPCARGESSDPLLRALESVDPHESETGGERWVDGRWPCPTRSWDATAEERILAGELDAHLRRAIEALPPQQREVITLRDVEGFSSEEACNILHLTETNQRVLLHRARSRVRRALEHHLGRRGD